MSIAELITRFDVSERASLAVRHKGTGYFAVTPKAPYDGNLSIEVQAQQLFEKLDARLAEIGSARDRMLLVAIVLKDMSDYEEFNTAWTKWLAGTPPPARGCFSAVLANPHLKIELFVICATDE